MSQMQKNVLYSWKRRSVLVVEGPGREAFLEGLITNTLHNLAKGEALFSAFLTPQGKFEADFLILAGENAYFLLIDTMQRESLAAKWRLYKLRHNVTFSPFEANIYASEENLTFEKGHSFKDPRHEELGWVHLLPKDAPLEADFLIKDYDAWRMPKGIPDGLVDLTPQKSFILEYGYDELNAISWQKGCYLGQELIARTKHRGQLRHYIFPLSFEGTTPIPGEELKVGDLSLGKVLSVRHQNALARLKLEILKELNTFHITQGEKHFKINLPCWVKQVEDIYQIAHLT